MIARVALRIVALAAACIPFVGCHGAAPPPRVALVAGERGFGDRSFNDAARAGLEACKRDTGAEVTAVVPSSGAGFEQQLALLATQNYDTVIALGYPPARDVAQVARRFQAIHFAIIDAVVDEPNVDSITFDEAQGAFLAGALAAMVSRTHTVAFLGGADSALLRRSEAGFSAGARDIDPAVRVEVRYLGSFDDRPAARRLAGTLLDRRADVIFAVAGRAGLGAIDAVKQRRDAFAIGADSNQDGLAPGKVLTSVVKRVDVAAQRVCTEAVAQKPMSGHLVLGLAQGGIALTDFAFSKNVLGAERIARIERVRRAIVAGSVVAPASREALRTFRPVAIP